MARQPIFDKNLSVFAYELLFRNNSLVNAHLSNPKPLHSQLNEYDTEDQATSNVLINSYLTTDFEAFSGGKKIFINFTKHLVMNGSPTVFPKDSLVVELLETIEPDGPFMGRCRQLKKDGYLLALDDYVHARDAGNPLLELVDILKVDFLDNSNDQIAEIANYYRHRPIKLLAEKVETPEMFHFARKTGYEYFQGYFFSKPVMISGKNIHSSNKSYLLILSELYKDNPEFESISKIIETDLSLSYKLLRLVNSAAFYLPQEIKSIKQGAVMIGIKKLKKWILLLMLVDAGKKKPDEILRTSIIRGNFAELISTQTPYRESSSELFLMGLFSMISLIMNAPLEEILKDLPLSSTVKEALRGHPNAYKKIYDLVLLYESGDFEQSRDIALEISLPLGALPEYYKKSIFIAEEIMKSQL